MNNQQLPGEEVKFFTVLDGNHSAKKRRKSKTVRNAQNIEQEKYELMNLDFKNILFYSDKEIERILFETFISKSQVIRKEENFHNPAVISEYFDKKYGCAFFQGTDPVNTFWRLENKISYEDFVDVICKHIHIPLIHVYSLNDIQSFSKYTLVFNWNFFEEIHMPPLGHNMLVKNLPNLPSRFTCHSNELLKVQKATLKVLMDTTANYTDSKIRGFQLSEQDVDQLHLHEYESPLFAVYKSKLFDYEFGPKTRDVDYLFKIIYKGKLATFQEHYQELLALFDKKVSPFRIVENHQYRSE